MKDNKYKQVEDVWIDKAITRAKGKDKLEGGKILWASIGDYYHYLTDNVTDIEERIDCLLSYITRLKEYCQENGYK